MSLGIVLLSVLLGAALGTGLASVIRWGLAARRKARVAPKFVDPQVNVIIEALTIPAVAVGPHDEVLSANQRAHSLGLARADRVGIPEALELARSCRERNCSLTDSVRLGADLDHPARLLSVHTEPLGTGAVAIFAEDQSAALRADESKRDLVANISHELKTPVGALQVLAETIQQADDDPKAVHHFADRMIKESQRLSTLVAQIINLSRVQSDDPLRDGTLVPIDNVVSTAIDQIHEQIVARHINFSVTGDYGLVVLGNKEQLTSALANLVSNAVTYSDSGARVVVTVSAVNEPIAGSAEDHPNDKCVRISVTDNGIGINPHEQDRVWERFYRVDYARSRSAGGTGLGLSIVKHIVLAHGGNVELWSKPGRGSTFTAILPLALDTDASESAEKTEGRP